jgi:hypothetical protein
MHAIRSRFLYASALALVLGAAFVVGGNGQIANNMVNLTAPIEAAAQVVVDSAEPSGNFTSYLPGSFR